tara:strand:- start:2 stop:220 length:219 start_codon:yes stop_codon:yes gene_type:complete
LFNDFTIVEAKGSISNGAYILDLDCLIFRKIRIIIDKIDIDAVIAIRDWLAFTVPNFELSTLKYSRKKRITG